MPNIQTRVGAGAGAVALGDGSTPDLRSGKLGDTIVSELHGQYFEQALRGNLFATFINALTLASTHASPIAAGTGTPIIAIRNPLNSGKNIVLLRTRSHSTSGTPGGPLLWNVVPNSQNITAATNATPWNLGTLTQTGSVAQLFQNTALTGSTVGTAFRVHGGPAAVAAGAGVYTVEEDHKGGIIIPQGGMLALAATAAGTSHIIGASVDWEEVPV